MGQARECGHTGTAAELKTQYRCVYFLKVGSMQVYSCKTVRHNILLGQCTWHAPWKRWVMTFRDGAVFSERGMLEVLHFLRQVNEREGS